MRKFPLPFLITLGLAIHVYDIVYNIIQGTCSQVTAAMNSLEVTRR